MKTDFIIGTSTSALVFACNKNVSLIILGTLLTVNASASGVRWIAQTDSGSMLKSANALTAPPLETKDAKKLTSGTQLLANVPAYQSVAMPVKNSILYLASAMKSEFVSYLQTRLKTKQQLTLTV